MSYLIKMNFTQNIKLTLEVLFSLTDLFCGNLINITKQQIPCSRNAKTFHLLGRVNVVIKYRETSLNS